LWKTPHCFFSLYKALYRLDAGKKNSVGSMTKE